MPNLNEITKFREDLKNIAHEDEITARWGERVYDELPPPDPAEVPDIDLDALLPATEPEQTASVSDTVDESSESIPASQQHTEPTSGMFDTVPVTDAPDISMDTPFPIDFDNLGTNGTSAQSNSIPSDDTVAAPQKSGKPSTAFDEPEVVTGDAYPVDEEGMPDTSDMDAFLSSFNFDNLSGDDAVASDTAESDTADTLSDELDDPFA